MDLLSDNSNSTSSIGHSNLTHSEIRDKFSIFVLFLRIANRFNAIGCVSLFAVKGPSLMLLSSIAIIVIVGSRRLVGEISPKSTLQG